MSISVMSRVWQTSRASHGAMLVALAIADFADDGGWAYPSVQTLAKKSRLSERSTQAALAALVKLGELKIHVGSGPNGCNRYHLATSRRNNTPAESAPPQFFPKDPAESAPKPSGEPSGKRESSARPGQQAVQAHEIYKAYPKKTGKQAALKNILAAMKMAPFETLLERTQAFYDAVQLWPQDQLRYVPDPERWFKKGHWEDDPATWIKTENAPISVPKKKYDTNILG